MKISTVKQMRDMDRTATDAYGIPETILMENAGIAAFSVIANEVGIKNNAFAVFCGTGNNGGDGFVVARKLHSAGSNVTVCILGDRSTFKGAARANLDIISSMAIDIKDLNSTKTVKDIITASDVIVDAIFGTGLSRNIEGLYKEVIELINKGPKTVVCLDIPSGINGNTGSVMGCAVEADYTVTFGLPKIGNMLYPGFGLCGKLYTTHISFPPKLQDRNDLLIEVNDPPKLAPRIAYGHKGDFGKALFIAGASGYYGAPYLAAMSFLKAGGGYSRLAAPASITPFIANKGSEIVMIPQKETQNGSISFENKKDLIDLSEKMDIVVIGPGLSLDTETSQLVRDLSNAITCPVVIDGDGITAICQDLDIIRKRKAPTILTPHTGEMERITGIPSWEINADRIKILQQTAKDLQAIIVLKGAHSLIGYPDERVFINISGNPGMATAGSGDVLTGTIAAMNCLGLDPGDALRKAVYIHGASGDIAAIDKGADGITAQDILESLPHALQMDRDGLLEGLYTGLDVI